MGISAYDDFLYRSAEDYLEDGEECTEGDQVEYRPIDADEPEPDFSYMTEAEFQAMVPEKTKEETEREIYDYLASHPWLA